MLELIFPRICPFCDSPSEGEILCAACLSGVRFISDYSACQRCGAPFLSEDDTGGDDALCRRCRAGDFLFHKARSIAFYDCILKDVLHAFKYEGKLNLSGLIASVMTENFPSDFERVDVVVPVPLHRNKLRAREYNQCAVLGRRIADFLGATIELFALVKIADTSPQVEMKSDSQRRRNVSGAYSVKSPRGIQKKSALLIDDVFTTGSTANECARALLDAGAASVQVLTLLRSVKI
ncbi:MAG: double zinc ribbon domain-containing protein [Deltaproteobacteria bacterium]